jgi:hypothetical protein
MAVRHRTALVVGAWAAVSALLLSSCASEVPSQSSARDAGVDLSKVSDGWGPDRPMFRADDRPTEPALNAVQNNPQWGDERSFLKVRDTGKAEWAVQGDIALVPGRTYEGVILFHNAARAGVGAGNLRGTHVRAQLPASLAGRGRVSAIVSSGNAAITAVWRSLVMTSPVDQAVAIRIVPDSARLSFARRPDTPVSVVDLFSDRGALISCAAAPGVVPADCQGEVSFRFVADQPNFIITQEVSRSGAGHYGYDSHFSPGDEVDLKMQYKNTGTTQQNDVVLRTEWSPGVDYVTGSMRMANSATGNKWTRVPEDVPVGRFTIGSYAPQGNAYVRVTVRLPAADSLGCGFTSVFARAVAETKNGSKSVTTDLWIEKKC